MKKLLLAMIVFFTFSGFVVAAVNLNIVSKAELDVVKGLGLQMAEAILDIARRMACS